MRPPGRVPPVETAAFDYELPAERDRPGADRAPRRRPAAGRRRPGGAARRTATCRDLPDAAATPATSLVVNDTRVLPARLHLRQAHRRRGRGAPARAARPEPADGGRRWCGPAASWRPGRGWRPPTARRRRRGRGPRRPGEGRRVVRLRRPSGDVVAATRSWPPSSAVGEVPLPPYITDDAGRPRALPDRVRPTRRLGRRAHRRAAPHRRRCSTGSPPPASRSAPVELEVGPGHVPPDHHRPGRGPRRCTPRRYRVPAATLDAVQATRADGGRVVAVGTTAVRALESAARDRASSRAAPTCSSAATYAFAVVDRLLTNFHLPRSSLLVLVDAFVGPRWRAPVRRRPWPSGYRFLSFGDAMLARRGAARSRPGRPVRRRPVRRRATVDVDGATDGEPPRGRAAWSPPPGGRSPRRASCRWAPGARCGTSSPPTSRTSAPQVILGNTYHLMLRPGRRRWSPSSAACTASWTGTATSSPTRAASRSSRSSPKVDDDGATFRSHLRRHHATTSRPRARSPMQAQARRRHPDGARRVPAAARRRPAVVRAAVDRTARWAERAEAAHRPGRRASGRAARPSSASCRAASTWPCAPRAPRAPSTIGFDGYGIGGLSVGETRDEMLPALAAATERAARRPAPLPDGRGRPGRPGRGRRPRRRHVRLRAAHPPRPPRHGPHRRRPAEPAQRPLRPRRRAARPDLPVPGLRPLVAGLPAPPAAGRTSPPSGRLLHDPQRGLDVAPGRHRAYGRAARRRTLAGAAGRA